MPTFISYSQKDAAAYERVCDEFDRQGVKRWDAQTMRVAASLSEQLREAVNTCGDCVFLATENSIGSGWPLAEVGAFWGASKKVYVFAPGTTGIAMPKQFEGQVWTSDLDRILNEIKQSRLEPADKRPGPVLFVASPNHPFDRRKLEVIRRAWTLANDKASPGRSAAWYEINSFARIVDADDLADRRGLFITTSYKQKLNDGLISQLVAWVRAGGNLAVSCFELGERHHATNLNQLLYHFGIQFNNDVIIAPRVSPEKKTTDKDWGKTLRYDSIRQPPSSPPSPSPFRGGESLLRGVRQLFMKNACSLDLSPGVAPLVLARPNQILELALESAVYAEEGLAVGKQEFGMPYADDQRAVIALATPELTGSGRVLAMGTWDFQSDGIQGDNDTFLANLWSWLMGVDDSPNAMT